MSTYLEQAQMLFWDREFAMLHSSYVAAVNEAGAVAVMLPPQNTGADEVLARIDGLLLSGGADVDPERYGAIRSDQTADPRVTRDEWEIRLVRDALRRDIPVLAVCRGLQILNVALGGTLHQHLPDVTGNENHQPKLGVFGSIEVDIDRKTRTAELLGTHVEGSCFHHQAVARLAPGLTVTGRAADHTVEAVEVADAEFAIGVQWHPEERPADLRLFAGLVSAAQRHRARVKEGAS